MTNVGTHSVTRSRLSAEHGTILSIWAHPDDETYLAAGIMAAAVANGDRVVCVSATAGEHGTADPIVWPPARLGQVRRWEANAAMAVLGVTEHRFLGYEDGTLADDDPDGIDHIAELIDEIRPETILTFGADGMTFHPDHIAIHHWVTAAWDRVGCPGRLLYATTTIEFLHRFRDLFEEWNIYMTDQRPTGVPGDQLALHVRLAGSDLDRKLTALRAMATQTAGLLATVDADIYAAQAAEEAFIAARPYATTKDETTVTMIRPFTPADADRIVELSLAAWEPVFTSFRDVLGAELYERVHPDWRGSQADEGVLGDWPIFAAS